MASSSQQIVILFGLLAVVSVAQGFEAKRVYRNGNATVTITQDVETGRATIVDGPYGSDGGSTWTDEGMEANGQITAMVIRAGDNIDSIQVRYGETWGEVHGGDGGQESTMQLPDGEPLLIDVVFVKADSYGVHHLEFYSLFNGGFVGSFGGGAGIYYYSSHPQCELQFLSGSAGLYMDAITFHYTCPDGWIAD